MAWVESHDIPIQDSSPPAGFTGYPAPLAISASSDFVSSSPEVFGVFTKKCWNLFGIGLAASITLSTILTVMIISYRADEAYNPQFSEFVQVNNGKFEMYCRPFYIAGYNAEDLMQIATLTSKQYKLADNLSGERRIVDMFNEASQAGLNVVRTWAHTSHPKFPFKSFNRKKGKTKYHEPTFRALDFILNEARLHGMKVILSFIDNWQYHNGVGEFVDWGSSVPKRKGPIPQTIGDPQIRPDTKDKTHEYEAKRHTHFFDDASVKNLYKDHVKIIINRRNTFHGRRYKDDPTILAWDLINEPRCEVWAFSNCTQSLHAWIKEMSAYVKSLDSNHLVTVGAEGFFGPGEKWEEDNPGTWSSKLGNSFIRDHSIKDIDFASIHFWPDNWNRQEAEFQNDWIQSHVEASNISIGKPLLVEEFGKKLQETDEDDPEKIASIRNPSYNLTYKLLEDHIQSQSGGFVGTLFWRYYLETYEGQGRSSYGVHPSDSTFPMVRRHTNFIKTLLNSEAPGTACVTDCWVPYRTSKHRVCVPAPDACQKYWEIRQNGTLQSEGEGIKVRVWDKDVDLSGLQFFANIADCCRRGMGAFAKGCTYAFGWVPH